MHATELNNLSDYMHMGTVNLLVKHIYLVHSAGTEELVYREF